MLVADAVLKVREARASSSSSQSICKARTPHGRHKMIFPLTTMTTCPVWILVLAGRAPQQPRCSVSGPTAPLIASRTLTKWRPSTANSISTIGVNGQHSTWPPELAGAPGDSHSSASTRAISRFTTCSTAHLPSRTIRDRAGQGAGRLQTSRSIPSRYGSCSKKAQLGRSRGPMRICSRLTGTRTQASSLRHHKRRHQMAQLRP